MATEVPYRRLYSCGTHVVGHGRLVKHLPPSPPGQSSRSISRGIVISMPSRQGELYMILDELTFVVLESREDEISAIP
jgi:hypothetical protein